MDLTELKAAAADIYLPNFEVAVYQDRYLGPHVRLVGTLPDNTDPTCRIDLGINAKIPPCRHIEQFLAWFEQRWIEIWIHEAREMFFFRGNLYSDPHKEQ
jgi:hypothetical protein